MDIALQVDRARALRRMHDGSQVLLLPNAWDAGSARLFERRGFAAVATTSGGMAWSLGYQDGEQVPLEEVLAVARITRVCGVPVTVDFEGGYGATPAAVGASVRAVIEAGAAGVNLEDGTPGHGPLRPLDEAAARIAAARGAATASGVPLVINARVDLWMHDVPAGAAPARMDEAVRRARAYLAAGADCIYPIGLRDRAELATLVRAVGAPVNVAAGPGVPSLGELARIGVARVSTATRLATLALAAADRAVGELRSSGRFDALAGDFGYADVQQLLVR